jgi:2-keto-4-pentenoate hydratase/2-oxohepta-3-ene-1,7-dioic acid hydratase in catechol pathway
MRSDFLQGTRWALATLQTEDGPLAVLETGDGLYDLGRLLAGSGSGSRDVADLFDDWAANSRLLDRLAADPDPALRVEDGVRLAPLLYPGKVLCAGANYYRHLEEMGLKDVRKDNQRLFFFFKPARNAVVGEGATVHMPLDTEQMDWEIELAVVIGKAARAVSPEQAMDHVAGYMVGIDACARDLNKAPETFYKLDWVAGKAQESCCPLGPRFVPASAVRDPQALHLTLSVNGVKKQDDTTGDMIFSIAEQISTASRLMQLDPGDVLLTGTPAGVGSPRGEFLKVGDRIEAEIEGIGRLEVEIRPPSTKVRVPLA